VGNEHAPRRISVGSTGLLALTALALWFVLRVILAAVTGPTQAGGGGNLATALALGAWFDAGTLAYLLAPWIAVSAMLSDRWRSRPSARLLRWGAVWCSTALLVFGVVAEFVFWDEFSARFNFIAVDYLIYTGEVIGNIRESYPVGWLVAGILVLTTLLLALIRRFLMLSDAPRTRRRRAVQAATAILLPMASYALVNVDQMSRTGNAYADELSGNGLFSFAAAMRRNELDYDQFYRTMPQEEADAVLKALGVEREPLSKAIAPPPDVHEPEELGPLSRHPRHVVLITVESLSAEFLGAYGDKRGLTPNLDRLATEGLKFERLFATGTRTVRGLEALSLGTPPVPGQAIVRRPTNEHLATVGEILEHQGFLPYFIYGGYGYFDNMNAYFSGNDYKVIDRTDFPKASISFENIWGVADEVLFANALTILDGAAATGKRFFAQIMTTSNHRPYTYPDGRIDIASPGGREGAVKYTDFAIGQFIERARGKPWFKDTLFVIVADHCASVAGKTRLPVANYHIPMIFYGPDFLKPGIYARMASQIDLAPTLLDLLRAEGDDHFFGESLFENDSLPARAFISNYQELGYYTNDVLTVLAPKQKVEAFRIDSVTFAATPIAPVPQLAREAVAYYQTSSRAFRQGALRSPDYRTQRGVP